MGNDQKVGYEVADVLRKYLVDYQQKYKLSREQYRATQAIMICRTPAMGGLLKLCDNHQCRHYEFSYKPCRNRHCPKCGSFEKAQWLEAQKIWLLPINYFHVVFTIDHIFNPLIWRNQYLLYSLIIQTAANLLKAYGQKYLGGDIGCTLILHTWGQTMQPHLHVHFIVTGGALVKTPDGYRWQAAKPNYLFPVKLLSKDFLKAFCAGVLLLSQEKRLDTAQGELDIAAMLAEAQSKDWEVFIQPPICGIDNLMDYLARYIFRIAISNQRILSIDHGQVSFEYFDNRNDGKLKVMSLPAVEFIRRFLAHVLPSRFVRVRHYGLHHGSCRKKLQVARRLLGLPPALPIITQLMLLDWLKKILKSSDDPRLCPVCRKGLLLPVRKLPPTYGWRSHLLPLLGFLTRWLPVPT
jgi:hypothetical protein